MTSLDAAASAAGFAGGASSGFPGAGAAGFAGAASAGFPGAAAAGFPGAAPAGVAWLDDRERELLSLLAAGLTDGSVAARLGVSERTVRRTMAAIMLRLGARSRFQAGLIAARLELPAPATVCSCAGTCHRGRHQPAPGPGRGPAGSRLRG